MIKAFLLIFFPVQTWEQIAAIQRKPAVVMMFHLLPLLVLSTAAECFGLVHWGRMRGEIAYLVRFPVSHAVVFGVGRILLSLLTVLLLTRLIKALGETFHGRHSFQQVFTVAAYGLSPLFLLQALNAIPVLSPWLTWIVGVFLSASVLYSGLPIIMKPDPPHALGLYLMTCLLMTIVTGLISFLTVWYVQGKFEGIDSLVAGIGAHLPF
ncbi:MAG: Yip1 family protein [Verrucomicrobiota bacterium]